MRNNKSNIPGWSRVLLIIFPYLMIAGTFQLIGAAISGASFSNPDILKTPEQQLIISFFGMVGTFLVLWIFMKFIDREKFIDLGFQTKNRSLDFLVGTGVGLLTMILGFVLLLGIGQIDYSGVTFDFKEMVYSVLLFLIVAVVEEALCRGYVQKNLMLSTNRYVALIISSAIFALMHGFNPNISFFALFDLFCAGLILGITYIYTKNLWYPIGLHFGWNLFQTHLGFNVSGQDFYSLVEFNYTSPNLLNGGEFGFEGSIFSVVAQILIFIGAFYYYQIHSKNISERTLKQTKTISSHNHESSRFLQESR